MALTNLGCQNAKPKEKPYKLFDGKGLYLEVRPNGARYWRFKYRYLGKEKLLAIGVYPEITLADAREACLIARKQLRDLIDPSAAKKQRYQDAVDNQANNFESVALEWHRRGSCTLENSD